MQPTKSESGAIKLDVKLTKLSRAPYVYLTLTLFSTLMFLAILFVPLFAPLLWELIFAKTTGVLIFSVLASTLSVGISGLFVTLTDKELVKDASPNTINQYNSFHDSAALRWTSLLFLGISLTLSVATQLLITTPLLLTAASIALGLSVITAGLTSGMIFGHKHLGVLKLNKLELILKQEVTQQITQQITNVSNHEHNTTVVHQPSPTPSSPEVSPAPPARLFQPVSKPGDSIEPEPKVKHRNACC